MHMAELVADQNKCWVLLGERVTQSLQVRTSKYLLSPVSWAGVC